MNIENSLWVEKYRPKDLDTYIGNEQMKEKFQYMIETQDIGNLLLSSPPGLGKTTIAKILVKLIDCDYIYINASSENNVETVRTKIQGFAQTIGFSKWKIIICDEFDYFSLNGQAALRSIMEVFSANTRFILTCNYVENIIDPIKSRCQHFTITPPTKTEIAEHMVNILDTENVKYDINDVALLINASYPDIRKILGSCQRQSMKGELKIDKQSVIESNYMLKLVELLKDKKLAAKDSLRQIRQLVMDSKVSRFNDLFIYLYETVDEWSNGNSAACIIEINDAQYKDINIVGKELNIAALMVKLLEIIR